MSLGWVLSVVVCASGAETSEVTLTAERVLHDGKAERSIAEGKAHLEMTGAAIDAERIVYEKATGRVVAIGNVVARIAQEGSPTAIVAELVQLELEGERVVEVHVLDGTAWAKAGANVPKLLAAKTLDELDAAGPTTMVMSGNHFTRTDGGGWLMEQLELTPCDCDLRSPGWSIWAPSAVLNPDGDRVSVRLPSFWIKKVPLVKELPFFALPWINLPLGDRATGLLFPKPGSTVLNGFSFEQPVFITLGRSADLTLTPGYFFGGARRSYDTPGRQGLFASGLGRPFGPAWRNGELDPVPSEFQQPFGIMGPRLLSEFRYVLSPRAQGRVTLGLLYDLREARDPGNPGLALRRERGLRGEASLLHVQDFGAGFGARVDLSAYSDGYYQRDITPDVIARDAGYLRSAAVLFHRGANHLLTLDAVLRQDLTAGYDLFGRDLFPRTSTAPKLGPNPIQRLPALTFSMPVRTLVGPLAFDLTADAVQQRPLRGLSGDEGALAGDGRFFDLSTGLELPAECVVERLFLARPPRALTGCPALSGLKRGLGDGLWQPGEREARLRLNVLPRLWLAGTLGGVALSATAGWRQGAWWGQASGDFFTRGYPLFTSRAELELAKVYGAVRHTITPVLEARAVPFVAAASNRPFDPALLGGPAAYDELDRSVSDNRPRVQAVAELRSRLVERGGRELVRLEVGQGFDLRSPVFPGPGGVFGLETLEPNRFNAPRLAESYARLGFSLGWFTVTGQGRLEPFWRKTADAPVAPRVTRASATFSADFPGGHGLFASYENVLDDGTNRARAPVDLLFGDPVVASAESRAQLGSVGGRVKLGQLMLRYDLLLLSRRWPVTEFGPLDDAFSRLSMGLSPNVIGQRPGPVTVRDLPTFAQQTLTASWTPACDCFRLDLSVAMRVTSTGSIGPLEFAQFNFVVNKIGAIGATQ